MNPFQIKILEDQIFEIFYRKFLFNFLRPPWKIFQATREAFSPPKKKASNSKHFPVKGQFILFLVNFAFLDLDPQVQQNPHPDVEHC
jgi:hypothetical protein